MTEDMTLNIPTILTSSTISVGTAMYLIHYTNKLVKELTTHHIDTLRAEVSFLRQFILNRGG